MKLRIEVSARHVHLSQKDLKKLFCKIKLSFRNKLSETDEFASNETVDLVGPRNTLLNVRVLGPFRDHSQVEISRSNSIYLGIDAPLKLSGDLPGERIRIIGPKGEITKNIAIVPMRHFHANPKMATKLKLKNHSKIKIKILGKRGLIFDNVIVRVDEGYKNNVHLDTDEANAAGIEHLAKGELIK